MNDDEAMYDRSQMRWNKVYHSYLCYPFYDVVLCKLLEDTSYQTDPKRAKVDSKRKKILYRITIQSCV